MLSIARGLAYLLASGLQGTVASNVPMRDESVNFLGGGYVGPVPVPGHRDVRAGDCLQPLSPLHGAGPPDLCGRQQRAGGPAFRRTGDLVKLFVYTITGTLAALAGIMTAGLLGTSATNAGTGTELDVIAAVVIGGASLAGGEGTIIGSIIGAAIMAVLRNAFVLLQFPDLYADHFHRRRNHSGGGARPDAPAQSLVDILHSHTSHKSDCLLKGDAIDKKSEESCQ